MEIHTAKGVSKSKKKKNVSLQICELKFLEKIADRVAWTTKSSSSINFRCRFGISVLFFLFSFQTFVKCFGDY